MKKIAVLLTCHNRRAKTILCLKSLFNAYLPQNFTLDVFLVDDGSIDGTSEAIKNEFPHVNIITGNGELFWNKGMRLAWKHASMKYKFDFYMWLNDDTNISNSAIDELVECYYEALKRDNKSALIVGACKSPQNNKFSYGGRTDNGPVIPNGNLQNCKYINGNVVLVSKIIYDTLGNLSIDYTHTLGDFDYGLQVKAKGFNIYTTKAYLAICSPNSEIAGWCNPSIPLKDRWLLLHSPKGLNLKEYNTFRKKFWGWKWLLFAIKAYCKTLSPKLYSKISNN